MAAGPSTQLDRPLKNGNCHSRSSLRRRCANGVLPLTKEADLEIHESHWRRDRLATGSRRPASGNMPAPALSQPVLHFAPKGLDVPCDLPLS